jgi:hypothetical protein
VLADVGEILRSPLLPVRDRILSLFLFGDGLGFSFQVNSLFFSKTLSLLQALRRFSARAHPREVSLFECH